MIGIDAVMVAAWSATSPASPLPCPYSTWAGAEPPITQVSFDPPPWLEFTTSWPSGKRDAGQPARKHPDVLAVVHRERAEVGVARAHPVLDERREWSTA